MLHSYSIWSVSYCLGLCFWKYQGLVLQWHTTELPGQIAENAESEDSESRWHLEEEVPVDKIHHACRCSLQLGQVDHKVPQQGNHWRQDYRWWNQLSRCDSTTSHYGKAPLSHELTWTLPHPTGQTVFEVLCGTIRFNVFFILHLFVRETPDSLWLLTTSLFPLILWGSWRRKMRHTSIWVGFYLTNMLWFCIAHCLQPGA